MLKVIKDPLAYFKNLTRDDNPYDWFSILGTKCLIINDSVAVQHVFQSNFENYRKSVFHKGLRPLLGEGIFLSEGPLWQKQRKEMAPFFAGRHFPDYMDSMVEASQLMTQRIRKKSQNGKPVDISPECMLLTLDVVLKAIFKDPRENIADDMRESLGLLLKDAEERIWSLVNVPQSIKAKFFPEYKNALKFLEGTVSDLMRVKKDDPSKDHAINDFVSVISDKYDQDNDIEKKLLRDQILSFLLAGHETTANALTWVLLEVVKNEQLRTQAEQCVQDVDLNNFGMDSFKDMRFILSIFEESLRVYPPVWTMSRQANTPDLIPTESGEMISVNKDQIIMISPYTLHRSKRYWSNAETFDPNRFMPDAPEEINKYAYIPYGAGPRLCLGHKFANIEGTIAMVELLKNFDMSIAPEDLHDITPEPLITLRPNKEVNITFKETTRNNQNNEAQYSFTKKEVA